MEGMFTPRYEKYQHTIYGLPFKVRKVEVDGTEIKRFSIDEQGVLEFSSIKKFRKIEVLA
ncbi:hypothetical protein D3C78_1726090 [compost metagenome]